MPASIQREAKGSIDVKDTEISASLLSGGRRGPMCGGRGNEGLSGSSRRELPMARERTETKSKTT